MVDLAPRWQSSVTKLDALAESDDAFRRRVLAASPHNQDMIFAINVASGIALDALGREFDVRREIGPVIRR